MGVSEFLDEKPEEPELDGDMKDDVRRNKPSNVECLAERGLCFTLPPPLNVVYFNNSECIKNSMDLGLLVCAMPETVFDCLIAL